MVSIRVLEAQRATKARQERLETARRQAAQLGVASARHYKHAKQEQTEAVNAGLRASYAAQLSAEERTTVDLMDAAQQQRGAGMRAAAEFLESTTQVAQREVDAWEAERRLDRMRHELALQRERSDAREAAVAKQQRVALRQSALAVERERSMRAVSLHRSAETSLASRQQRSASASTAQVTMHKPPGSTVVSVALGDMDTTSAATKAPSFQAARQAQRDVQNQRLEDMQRSARKRAAELVTQRRHEEFVKEEQRRREAAVQREMMQATLRRTARVPGQAEFQEEEARRAQRINHKAHLEFERIFLATDGWSMQRLQGAERIAPNEERDDTDVLFGAAAPAVDLMAFQHALTHRAIHADELGSLDNTEDEGAPGEAPQAALAPTAQPAEL